MLIGIPKEIKNNEFRVGLAPFAVRELVHHGHDVLVETGAGGGIGMDDAAYETAGAAIAASAAAVFERAEMIVKVKEPQAVECAMLGRGQILFTYLHLAPDPEQTRALVKSGCIAIAYETVTDKHGRLPLLAPMSEVAGRMAVQAAATCLEKEHGGAGVLMGGVPGVAPADVVVLGGGVVGTNAALVAMGMGARVTVLDKSHDKLRSLDLQYGSRLNTIYSTVESIEDYIAGADVVIGAVLVPGAETPKLVSRALIASMRPGSVAVDVAIDQGGCFETGRPTTHADPTYVEEGVVHYCVANMPGAVPRTSTIALNNATLPYVLFLADHGYRRALAADPGLMAGLNVHEGRVTYKAVAKALDYPFTPPEEAIAE